MRKGSVTIFTLLSMMLVISTLLALIEAGRFQKMNKLAELQTQVALESVFAEYNTYLWEDYRILACKLDEVENDLVVYGDATIHEKTTGINFFQFGVDDVSLKGYTRLTDGDGKAFIGAVSDYMKQNLLYESAKELYEQYKGIKDIQENSGFDIDAIEDALDELEKEENSEESAGIKKAIDKRMKTKGNPLEGIKDIQKKGILSLVLQDTSKLSKKSIDISNSVSHRQLAESYHPIIKESDWYDTVLLQQYLLTYMSHFLEGKEHSMQYEVEYIVGGKNTEIENLKAVVNKLLLIREAANFLYLSTSPQKVEQARVLAIAIAGASLNAILIEAVKTALLVAWAYAESILEIRTLLSGKKIALIKSDTTWNLDLDYITKIGEGYKMAKECKNGLDYEAYLGLLLLMESETKLAKRAMDMQEITLQEKYENASLHLDDWIIDVKTSVTYGYRPVFFSMQKGIPSWNYQMIAEEQYGYIRR